MWNGQFGARSPSQLVDQAVVIDGTQILVIFTSEDPVLETTIIPFVQGAQSSVYFMAFSFTDYPLADAMIQRHLHDVDVAGVFESFGSTSDAAELRGREAWLAGHANTAIIMANTDIITLLPFITASLVPIPISLLPLKIK